MKHITRRTALSTLAAAALFRPLPGKTEDTQYSESEVAQILRGDAEWLRRSKTLLSSFWFQTPVGQRPSANWPQDNVSYDYAHIVQVNVAGEPFKVSAETILTYMTLCSYPSQKKEKILFGLRGCVLVDSSEASKFANSHTVREARPNHVDLRCVMGVLDWANKKLTLFPASTVPNTPFMAEYAKRKSVGCNMMPTGLHKYRVGCHHGSIDQPGALRQSAPLWVHRAQEKLIYSTNDRDNVWDDKDGGLPGNNIHAGRLDRQDAPPFFSSAGCQVVAGDFKSGVPTGPWADFRRSAGLVDLTPERIGRHGETSDDGRQFDYILLTAKEAHILADGNTAAIESLRYGSRGDRVGRLQKQLVKEVGLSGDFQPGTLDRQTVKFLLKWQREKKLAPTAIVTRSEAPSLKIW